MNEIDTYYYPEDIDMAAKQPKKKPDQKPVEMKESIFGTMHPAEPKEDWINFKGLEKPVHVTQLNSFSARYGECVETGNYFHRHMMCQTSCGRFITREVANNKKSGWSQCVATLLYARTKDMFEAIGYARNDEDDVDEHNMRLYKVSPQALKTHTFQCDFDQKRYFKCDILVRVSGSLAYSKVACIHVSDDIDDLPFGKCGNCGAVFEKDHLNRGAGNFAGLYLCHDCFRKNVNNGIIRKHNDKHYPSRIICLRENLGWTMKEDGLIYSTMEKNSVPDERDYGVEVELELDLDSAIREEVNRFNIAKELIECLGSDFIITKEDGTLTTNGKYSDREHKYGPTYAGFEVVSAPAPLSVHRQRWAQLVNFKYFKILRAWDCPTCGFHVHLSREAIDSDLTGGKLLAFMNAESNRPFIWKVAGRSEVAFTRYQTRKVSDFTRPEMVTNDQEEDAHNRSRRVAINLSNERTVEMRIFRGTVNPRHIIRNVEFYDSLLEFCRPCCSAIGDIYDFRNYVNYVDRNRKRWPLLASWFAHHDIIHLKKVKRPDKVDFAKLTLNIQDIPEAELLKV
jgi:hypothetical protein